MTEFSRAIRLDEIGGGIERKIEATDMECAALARRFDLIAVKCLSASLSIAPDGQGIRIKGTLSGDAVAACAISAENVAQQVREDVDVIATADNAPARALEEIELEMADLDVVHIEDGKLDLGAVVADSFALALDPFPRADEAIITAARQHLKNEDEAKAEVEALKRETSPFAALKKVD